MHRGTQYAVRIVKTTGANQMRLQCFDKVFLGGPKKAVMGISIIKTPPPPSTALVGRMDMYIFESKHVVVRKDGNIQPRQA